VERAEGNRDKAQIVLSEQSVAYPPWRANGPGTITWSRRLTGGSYALLKEAGNEKDPGRSDGPNWPGIRRGHGRPGGSEKEAGRYDDDPLQTLERLQKRLEAAWETSRQALADEKRTEGELNTWEARGAYSALARAEEEVARPGA